MHDSRVFPLSPAEREALRRWAGERAERAVRARIVQDAADGISVSESARTLGVSRPTVTAWRGRYARDGLAGLAHRPRSGRPPRIDEADAVATTLAGLPATAGGRSARAVADHLGLSHTTLSAVWRRWHTAPDRPEDVVLPLRPVLPAQRLELLAVRAQADFACVVVAEPTRAERRPLAPAPAQERQARYTSLATLLAPLGGPAPQDGQAPASPGPPPTAPAPSAALAAPATGPVPGHLPDPAPAPDPLVPADALRAVADEVRALTQRHPGLEPHVLVWGAVATPAETVVAPYWHRPPPAMGWAATIGVLAQLELLHHPHRARGALDSLAASARAHALAPRRGAFRWQRPGESGPAPAPARPAHRAFDQFALGSFNEKLVIESIREAGALSRVEIAEHTGLTPQAVSRIARNLLTTGFLAEDERRPAAKGKPRVPLRLRADAACAIGLHLDPEMITLVVVDLCGTVLERRSRPLLDRRDDPRWCVGQMAALAAEAADVARAACDTLLGVGVAVPGPLDVGSGVVLDPPLFEGWREVPLRTELSARLGIPVLVEKDATAAAVGERWVGAADRSDDFVYLYLGSGAGSGAFLNGDVFRGSTGNAGEFGELCALTLGRLTPEGGPQLVRECAPISAVVEGALAAGFPGAGEATHEAVCAAAARGDERALGAVRQVARAVARGAVGLTDLYDVDLVIVGGPAVRPGAAEVYVEEIAQAVNRWPVARHVRQVRVARSRLNEAAAAVGAASSVFHTAFAPRLRHAKAALG